MASHVAMMRPRLVFPPALFAMPHADRGRAHDMAADKASPTPSANAARSGRVLEIDVLRGLAAVYVMLGHYVGHTAARPGEEGVITFDLPISTQFAVHLFFIISGYVIFYSLSRQRTVSGFAWSRFSRLYPTYWAGVLLTSTACYLLVGSYGRVDTLAEVAVNLTMLQDYFGVAKVDGVYWSLTVELAFYCWMAVLLKFGVLSRIEGIAWGWLLVCLVCLPLQRFEGNATVPGGTSFPVWADSGLLLRYAPLFMAGIAFQKLQQGDRRWSLHALLAACFFTYLFACVQPGLALGGRSLVGTVAVFAVFYLATYGRLRWLNWPPLVWLGTISYALYVTHYVAGIAFRYRLRDAGLPDALALPLTFAAALGLAAAITFWIERPANRRLRAFWKRPVPEPGGRNVATSPV